MYSRIVFFFQSYIHTISIWYDIRYQIPEPQSRQDFRCFSLTGGNINLTGALNAVYFRPGADWALNTGGQSRRPLGAWPDFGLTNQTPIQWNSRMHRGPEYLSAQWHQMNVQYDKSQRKNPLETSDLMPALLLMIVFYIYIAWLQYFYMKKK